MADPKGFLVVPLAFNPSGDIRALECDADDNLKVSVKELLTNLTVNIEPGIDPIIVQVEPGTNPIIVDGKSPSIFNPIGGKASYSNTTLPAGSTIFTIATVPAGQVWRVTSYAIQYIGTITGVTLSGSAYDGATRIYFCAQYNITSSNLYVFSTNIIVNAGDVIEARVGNATLNDDLNVFVGYERIK